MGCGAQTGCREDWVCPGCRQALARLWIGAFPPPEGLDGAACGYAYAGPSAGIVGRMKYTGVHRLAGFMAEAMIDAERFLEPTGAGVVTFVPMHLKRQRARGYNHAELLARSVAEALSLPCEPLIERVRDTPQQARMDEAARRENLKDAFRLTRPVDGRRVILVDDVCTSGATAQGCAGALRAGGAESVYLLCYARAKREMD